MKLIFDPRAERFVEKLADKDVAKVLEYIDLFEEFGFGLEQRYLKKVKNRLWELRPGRVRLFLVSKTQASVIIHASYKKSRQITKKDMATINQRLKEYI